MPLVDARGFNLTPDIVGSFGRGAQVGQGFQLGQLQIEQVKAQQAKQAQLQALLGQLGSPGAAPGATPGIGGLPGARGAPLPPGVSPAVPGSPGIGPAQPPQPMQNRSQALAQMAVQFPAEFEKINANLGLISQQQKDEAASFAFKASRTPPEQRPALIQQRVEQMRAQGRDASDTVELLNMTQSQQDSILETIQIAALNPKQRLDVARGTPLKTFAPVAIEGGKKGIPTFDPTTGEAGLVEIPGAIAGTEGAAKVQSSKLLPGGLVQMVMDDGTVRTVPPEQANEELIKAAEERGAELQGLRAGERGAASEAIKSAAASFKTLAGVRKNIANMDEGIKLLDEGAKVGAVEGRLPSIRAASVKLDNLRGRLGLDVIGAATFGALSEGELQFALAIALPKTLDEEELKVWLQDKRSAQHKLATNLEEAALFLGTPGNTIAEFIKLKKDERDAKKVVPKSTVGRFKVEVVQ